MVPDQWHPWPDLGGHLKPQRRQYQNILKTQ